jgi:hypothetical protein
MMFQRIHLCWIFFETFKLQIVEHQKVKKIDLQAASTTFREL